MAGQPLLAAHSTHSAGPQCRRSSPFDAVHARSLVNLGFSALKRVSNAQHSLRDGRDWTGMQRGDGAAMMALLAPTGLPNPGGARGGLSVGY